MASTSPPGPETTKRAQLRGIVALVPAAALALGSLAAAVAAQYSDEGSRRAVAFFPPWWSAEAALAAASDVGAVIRVGAGIAVASDRSDLGQALRERGAWFVADARAAPACFQPRREIARP